MNTIEKIKCPNCGAYIDVNTALSAEIIKEKDKEYSKRLETAEAAMRENIAKENEEANILLQKSLREKSDQLKEFNKTKIELEKTKREKEEIEFRIAAEKEAEFTAKLNKERESYKTNLESEKERIKKLVESENELKFSEMKKKLDDQTALAEEMRRKAEQGSMQLQGEVQELAIEEILKDTFRFDIIEPVPKGMNGADVIQRIRSNSGNEAGIIAYESKRTKSFSKEWIGKLKEDGGRVKADLCVLVTEALPEDIDRIGQKDGVWICTFSEFRGIALVLRDMIIRVSEAQSSQTNKGEKMQMLYDYLNGKEFLAQIGSILETFDELRKGYIDERNKMERIWKTREKQLEKIMLNANAFIGSIKGIAGSSLQEIPMIEGNVSEDLL